MMEFEAAARRLANDQSKLKKGSRRGPPPLSAKAKREAEFRKKQQERVRAERERKKQQLNFVKKFMASCNRSLGVQPLTDETTATDGNLQLQATSIHGDGDKIALPPSVLKVLTERDDGDNAASPWTFRIGLLRPGYTFPSSLALQDMKVTSEDEMMVDSDDEENDDDQRKEAYLEELSHKYIAYTHGTVVEFTQEEGHVGIPGLIASALLDTNRRRPEDQRLIVPVTRTKDPAAVSSTENEDGNTNQDNDEDEKTPGHLAWGAFDVPSEPVEITMLRLPKGTRCTLMPTEEAIRNGFYELKDVKVVLEQSLIRTRATLSVCDVVHTWHRGFKFDLIVKSVTPSVYNAVSCINTDIEVDIASPEGDKMDEEESQSNPLAVKSQSSFAPGEGRLLSEEPQIAEEPPTKQLQHELPMELKPEPSTDQKEGICTVQIRCSNGKTGRRRFDVTNSTMDDLFAYVASIMSENGITFQLATRFPRTVFTLNDGNRLKSMKEAGIQSGQEQFFVETL